MAGRVTSLKITLGPVPCKDCRRFVALVAGQWRDAIPERQRGYFQKRVRGLHKCPALVQADAA